VRLHDDLDGTKKERGCAAMEKQPMAIEVRGARVHNLKNISVDIPLHKIVGIAHVVTVTKGQTLYSLSKSMLGPGMECYIEAVNGNVKELKEGQKIKIPKLELKKTKTTSKN